MEVDCRSVVTPFLLHNVHDDGPVLLHSRWAMSYLRGPLSRDQIEKVMRERKAASTPTATARQGVAAAAAASAVPKGAVAAARPVLPDGITQRFQAARRALGSGEKLVYKPALLASTVLHYQSSKENIDLWRKLAVVSPLQAQMDANPWDDDGVVSTEQTLDFDDEPDARGAFAALPAGASQPKAYAAWSKQLKDELYRSENLQIAWCPELKLTGKPGESEGDFRARIGLAVREQRDRELSKLQQTYQPKLLRLVERRRNAEQVVDQQKAQRRNAGLGAVINVGTSILGSLFGRKKVATGVTTAIKGMSKVGSEQGDVRRAQEDVEALEQQERELNRELSDASTRIQDQFDANKIVIESKDIAPKKADTRVEELALLWTPWAVDASGRETPLAS